MEKRFARQVLQNIAERRTSGHADLWTRIAPRLKPIRSQRRMLRFTRLGWVTGGLMLIITASLLVGAATYAYYQFSGSDFDPGLTQVRSHDMGVALGDSQTVDGITVTLDWAYADAHRINISLSFAAENVISIPDSFSRDIRLTDSHGNEFPMIFGGGGWGGGGGGGDSGPAITASPVMNWNGTFSENFDASRAKNIPAELDLHLDLLLHPSWAGNETVAGPFAFDFTVPMIPAVIVRPETTVTARGIAATLHRVSFTPSSTKAYLCFEWSSGSTWLPVATLDTGDGRVNNLDFSPPLNVTGQQLCGVLDFLAPYDRQPESWVLTIEQLQSIPAETPDQLIGPWVFPIEVPES